MASRIYTQSCVDGTSKTVRRSIRQGAPKKPNELLHSVTLPVRMKEAEYKMFLDACGGIMSNSSFANLMIFTGIRHLSESNNC